MLTVNREGAKAIILACAKSGRTAHMIGPPGIGKTDLAGEIAAELGLPFVPFRTSTKLPEDAGGYMSPDSAAGVVKAMPLDALARICREPCFFFVDEMINGSLAVRAGLLQLLDERRIGDMKLHPKTVVCLASNPENQSTGGVAESLPERNRCVRFMLKADAQGFQAWLYRKAADADAAGKSAWATLARTVAATLDGAPELLQIDPPEGIEAGIEGWASNRAWHCAIDVLAEYGKDLSMDPLALPILAGCIGDTSAVAFLNLYKLRGKLPSVDAIVTDPSNAALPSDLQTSIAALGVIAEVARRDPGAAYVYGARIDGDIRLAVANVCGQFPFSQSTTKFAAAGQLARNTLMAAKNAALAGR